MLIRFRSRLVTKIEEVGKYFEGKAGTILYAVGALIVLLMHRRTGIQWLEAGSRGGAPQDRSREGDRNVASTDY